MGRSNQDLFLFTSRSIPTHTKAMNLVGISFLLAALLAVAHATPGGKGGKGGGSGHGTYHVIVHDKGGYGHDGGYGGHGGGYGHGGSAYQVIYSDDGYGHGGYGYDDYGGGYGGGGKKGGGKMAKFFKGLFKGGNDKGKGGNQQPIIIIHDSKGKGHDGGYGGYGHDHGHGGYGG